MFWSEIWLDNRRPKHGILVDSRRKPHIKYKQVAKALKTNFQNDVQSNSKRKVLKEATHIGEQNKSLVNMIEGKNGSKNAYTIFSFIIRLNVTTTYILIRKLLINY